MRVNIYAEEMTDRVELITKEVEGHQFTAVRFYLELPATVDGKQHQGPFIHRPGDDDSSAVTFWGKKSLRPLLQKALDLLPTSTDSPLCAALADISARKAVLIEAYGFTEQTETEGATEIDDGWDAATMRGYGEWAAIISLEDILKGER